MKDTPWYDHYIYEPYPMIFRVIGELDDVPVVKPKWWITTLCSKNKVLKKMRRVDAKKLGGKKIRILYMYDPKKPAIIGAGNGKLSYRSGIDHVMVGSGSGPRTNIIDWYRM